MLQSAHVHGQVVQLLGSPLSWQINTTVFFFALLTPSVRTCLVYLKSKIFSRFPIKSNLAAHV
jgi:hypothetical protein